MIDVKEIRRMAEGVAPSAFGSVTIRQTELLQLLDELECTKSQLAQVRDKLNAGQELAKASRPVANIVSRTLKDAMTQINVHEALQAYDKAGVIE